MDNKLDQAPVADDASQYEVNEPAPVDAHEHLTAVAAPWLAWMESHIGQHETHKTGHSNPFIVALFKHTTYKTNTDATPWCAAAVSTALEVSGYRSAHSASAFAYESYGTKCEAKPGAIVVFRWPTGGGHVSIVKSVGSGTIACTGGNQADAVKTSVFSRAHSVSYRWPVK